MIQIPQDSINSVVPTQVTEVNVDTLAQRITPIRHDTTTRRTTPILRDTLMRRTAAIAPDTVGNDTVPKKAKDFGITLQPPIVPEVKPNTYDNTGMSFILGGMALLFCFVGLRFRNNRKYLSAMVRNLVDVRIRTNAFDETVRETSFLFMLNLLWSISAGIVIWVALGYAFSYTPAMMLTSLSIRPAATIAICMGIGVLYTMVMSLAYLTVGTVFSDASHARLWLKGFTAGLGLLSLIYFPLSLVMLFYPQWSEILLFVALGTFVLTKIVFICKGFRIFFTQISSWVLFLYYLCSLEIVPIILTFLAAWWLCSLIS